MPILKHAKKKLKQDKKRTLLNKKVKNIYKEAVKKAKIAKNAKTVSVAFKAIDKAVKANIMHKNKAARMKSSLNKLISPSTSKTKAAPAKEAAPKTAKAKPVASNATAAVKAKDAPKTKATAKPKTTAKKSSPKTKK